MIKNVTQDLVAEKLDSMLSTRNCCKCDRCKEDMLAFALNQLQPKYVSTSKGELYGRTESLSVQHEFELMKAVAMAIERVGRNPKHIHEDGGK